MGLLSTGGLARASARHPWRVIALWVVVFLVGGYFASTIGDVTTTESNFINKPESVQGFDLINDRLNRKDHLTETVVITSKTETVDDADFQAVVTNVTSGLRSMTALVDPANTSNYYEAKASADPTTAAAAKGLVSADGHTTIIPVTISAGLNDATDLTDSYLDLVHSYKTDAVDVMPIGDLSINHEFNTVSEQDLKTGESIGIVAALAILVIVFGALVAAGVPILLSVLSIAIATGLAAIIGHAMDLSFFVTNMITMIGLAVGIDYALFIVSRYREERRHGRERLEAIEVAGSTASKAVLFSGMTVVFALFGLFLIPTTIFRSLGLGAILVVVVAVVVMLTFIPALLALLGDRIDWPRRRNYDVAAAEAQRRYDEETIHSGFWGRVARVVMTHPVVALVGAGALLIALAIPYFQLNTGFSGAESFPPGEAKTAYGILARDFAVGQLAPVQIALSGDKTEIQTGIDKLNAAVAAKPELARINPPQWDQAGDFAVVNIDLTTGPSDPASIRAVDELRSTIVPQAFAGSGVEHYVTGEPAFNKDFFDLVDHWTPIVFLFVLGLSFLLLTLAFRSIVVPAKAIVMNLLSVGAAYGLLVLVFQKGFLTGVLGFQKAPTIEAWIPIFLFCVLFGLSMDYHVFLLSRVREHYDLTHRNRESVAVGLQSTARIITGAALIMVAVFAGFAMGRLVMFQQMGFGLGVAVLIDATVVRSILVPSAMVLLGDRNWYLPKWLTWLPDLRVESPKLPAPAQGAPSMEATPAD
jgi:RND superfamily putative drug exporter